MTSNNFWRIRPFVKRIKREWNMHPSDVIGMLRFEGYRWIDIERELKCPQSTISRYIREEDKSYYHLSPEGREVKRQTAINLNERMDRGEIKRGGFARYSLRNIVSARDYDTSSNL